MLAALAANAIRPLPGYRSGIPSFFAGWLTGELAPQLLALAAADAGTAIARGRASRTGLALAAVNVGALAVLVGGSRKVREQVEEALEEGLGVDYVEQLDEKPTPAELATPWRSVVFPFRMKDSRVAIERDVAFTEAGSRGHLDIYRPASGDVADAPVLLQVHGGAWTIGQQGPAGHPADAAAGVQGLGVRGDQLPARAARRVPRPDRRRQAGDRLGQGAHRRVRRRP